MTKGVALNPLRFFFVLFVANHPLLARRFFYAFFVANFLFFVIAEPPANYCSTPVVRQDRSFPVPAVFRVVADRTTPPHL